MLSKYDTQPSQSHANALILIIIALVLSACSSTQPLTEHKEETERSQTKPENNPETFISAARTQQEPNRSQSYFKATELYWINNLRGQAKATIGAINELYLTDAQKADYYAIQFELAFEENNADLLNLLQSKRLSIYQLKVSPQKQKSLIEQLITSYEHTDDPLSAAITLIENSGLYSSDELPQVQNDIWSLLRKTEASTLSQFSYPDENYDVEGWLELATTFLQNQVSLEQQHQAVTAWQEKWFAHPAATTPPKELEILSTLPEQQPNSIVLALPFSGPLKQVGEAIRDGFIAAYYEDDSSFLEAINIRFFDTHTNDITQLYQTFENSLIIGPLDKKSLEKLAEFDEVNTTTLTLNHIDRKQDLRDQLFQFGLLPEDGINQLSERFIESNYRRVAMIAPEANWGIRIHDRFVDTFGSSEGIILDSIFYSDQKSLAPSVSRLLATDQSKQRSRKIASITGLNFEHNPRRRNDIDAILMIAKPKLAKQIKPLLAFHYAGQVPVFSTSQIHAPSTNNRDLNGIEFIEMPWMLSESNFLKNKISGLSPNTSEQYSRFYALGIDAFKLAPRIKLLSNIQGSQIQGNTGNLSIDSNGKVVRSLQWAKFKNSKAIAIKGT